MTWRWTVASDFVGHARGARPGLDPCRSAQRDRAGEGHAGDPAAESDRALGIVFYEPGKLEAMGWQVEANRGCVILLRQEGQAWTLSAADPTAAAGTLSLKIKQGKKQRRDIQLALPEAALAGSSVRLVL